MAIEKYDLEEVISFIKSNYRFRRNILTKKNQFYYDGKWFNYNNNISKRIQNDLINNGFEVPLSHIKNWCGTSNISKPYDPYLDDLAEIIYFLRKHKDYTYLGKNEFSKKVRRLKEISVSLENNAPFATKIHFQKCLKQNQ